jgi:serine/threonine protein kinase
MGKFHPPKSILLYVFLVPAFYGVTVRNRDVLKELGSTERHRFVASSMNHQRGGGNNDSSDHTFRDNSDQAETLLFRENLEIVKLIGSGDVSYAFEARYQNRTAIAKVATDSDLYYSDIEIGIFHELNVAPSIPNIPQLQLAIRSMPNPFANNPSVNSSISYIVDDLGLKQSNAESLVMKRRISVMVMDFLKGNRQPKDLEEVQRLMKSLLETMEFVHSRNIMHCDLHQWNYHWDGGKIYLFDWNGAFRYKPNKVWIHYPRTPKHLFPPEALVNTSAVHTSVYAFDVYSMGILMKKLLSSCCGITFKMLQAAARNAMEEIEEMDEPTKMATTVTFGDNTPQEAEYELNAAIAFELATYMMLSDPYQRPNTTEALQHVFFQRDLLPKGHNKTKKKNTNH